MLQQPQMSYVLCEVCVRAQASVICCADNAAMCAACDQTVHLANPVAATHERVALLPSEPPQRPPCDICLTSPSLFFCRPDRAFLCRACDLGVHAASAAAEAHDRYFLPLSRVALERIPPLAGAEPRRPRPSALRPPAAAAAAAPRAPPPRAAAAASLSQGMPLAFLGAAGTLSGAAQMGREFSLGDLSSYFPDVQGGEPGLALGAA